MKQYTPGLHILSTFSATETTLSNMEACRDFFNALVQQLQLTVVGEAYHQFANGGFTAVVCLTESHLSIHTWPEFGMATFDVFLSNYQNNNNAKAKEVYHQTLAHFEGTEINKTELVR